MAIDDRTTTVDQRKAVHAWMAETANRIGLKDWILVVDSEPPESSDAMATTTANHSYFRATFEVAGWMLVQPDAVIQRALVHELCHLYHGDLLGAWDELAEAVGSESRDVRPLRALMMRYVERMVDQMANQIIRHVALPSLDGIKKANADRLAQSALSIGIDGGAVD